MLGNMKAERALVGHTGFVGRTLLREARFDDLYNRETIEGIRARRFSLLVCAGAPAAKWYANQHAEEDRANLEWLMSCLSEVRADRFLLISTVDVYPDPVGVDETTGIDPEVGDAYGRHRFLLECFVAERFPAHTIVRLPGLFGEGLKKNLVYDLMTSGSSLWTHPGSVFQFYDMENLWRDLRTAMDQGLRLVNFATEPISAREIVRACGAEPLNEETEARQVQYDMRTRFADRLGRHGPYLYTAPVILQALEQFVTGSRVET
jgi:nucleoside-diphosphate-sugar epimerase